MKEIKNKIKSHPCGENIAIFAFSCKKIPQALDGQLNTPKKNEQKIGGRMPAFKIRNA
jgi:hypothetical protein